MQTVHDYLDYVSSHFEESGIFFGHGTDNPWDEAVALVLYALKLPATSGIEVLDRQLTEQEAALVQELMEERISKRVPIAYLTHEAWFAGLPFYVDQRVLIPRSPIGELIEKQFSPWIDPTKVHHILDLCTGSGCIAIACAKYFPNAHIDASDISSDALKVARRNVEKHHMKERVSLFESDVFDALPAKQYDIIVSNPPYVGTEEMGTLPDEYTHEPRLGLESGETGLDCVERILASANDYLAPHGILVVEVGNSEEVLIEKYPDMPFIWLEFERGGGGVFLLTKEQLQHF